MKVVTKLINSAINMRMTFTIALVIIMIGYGMGANEIAN